MSCPTPATPAGILIVEDEGIIAADLAACLDDLGYQIAGEAATGEDALLQAAARRPDLVLMDIKLAGAMDGITAANRLRLEQDIPVIFLTSHADDATLDRARESQPFGYLIKPFAERELRAAIETSIFRHTEAKRAEEERLRVERKIQEAQKHECIGVLARGIAHDFNNALTGINGNALLCRLKLDGESPVQPFLRRIETIAMRAATLCQQMLAYAGQGKLHVTDLDASTLVLETMSLLKTSTGEARVELDLSAGLPPIRGDKTQLQQIVMSLMLNAAEAMGEDPGEIRIATGITRADQETLASAALAADLPAGHYVFIEVADSGSGIPAEIMPRIFDPFFSTKFTGRGLGLTAVLGIVRSHGGAVLVGSPPGKGATFRLLLPLQEAPTALAETPQSA